ncbi:sporulation integral membrane protein YtvI [Oceanobacillus rekensis]|uniref:sporulation integral membrane protein YtvI n=1 Tax=Oceanobacillus rekensis TaxID=937927 RepID=UPI000B443252|nr:sporulation integral membrane protein YtvI [Oceanobacillus rekensis]
MQKSLVLQMVRFFIVICGFITIGIIFIYSFNFIYPLLVAVIISTIMYPFINLLEKKAKLPRFISIIFTMISLLLIFFGLLLLIITEVYQSSLFLADQIPKHFHSFVLFLESIFNNHLLPLYERLISLFHSLGTEQQVTITEYVRSLTDFVASSGTEFLHSTLVKVPAILAIIPGSLTTIAFIMLATFMISNDYENLKEITKRFIPKRAGKSIHMLISHLKLAINGFLKAQLTLIFISACIILSGLLVLQVDHALTITLFAAVVDLIPYVGTGILFIPWILYLYAMSDYQLTIGLSILYMILIISRQILEPKILSANIGIHPLIVLTGMFIGIQLWGFAGLLIAPIIIVLGNACYQSGIMQIIWNFIRG